MKPKRSTKGILSAISPGKLQLQLHDSHREIDEQLSSIVAQLKSQADSMFGGKPWSAVGDSEFGNHLIEHGKALTKLGENFNSGKLPQWAVDQQAAYEQSAIGKLQQQKGDKS